MLHIIVDSYKSFICKEIDDRTLGVRVVGGSNPLAPTNFYLKQNGHPPFGWPFYLSKEVSLFPEPKAKGADQMFPRTSQYSPLFLPGV